MSKTLYASAALAAMATAANNPIINLNNLPELPQFIRDYEPQVEYTPKVGETNFNIFRQTGPWARIDFLVGLSIGAYDVLQLEAYDYNCYSLFFHYFMNLTDDSKYFDSGLPDKGLLRFLFWVDMTF